MKDYIDIDFEQMEDFYNTMKKIYDEQKECIAMDIPFTSFIMGFIDYHSSISNFKKSLAEMRNGDFGAQVLGYIKYLNGDPQ